MKQDFFRGPMDELVCGSRFSAKKIAEVMGINYNRMVALRRAKKIHEDDLKRCKDAIFSLENPPPEKPKSKEQSFEDSLKQLLKESEGFRTRIQNLITRLQSANA